MIEWRLAPQVNSLDNIWAKLTALIGPTLLTTYNRSKFQKRMTIARPQALLRGCWCEIFSAFPRPVVNVRWRRNVKTVNESGNYHFIAQRSIPKGPRVTQDYSKLTPRTRCKESRQSSHKNYLKKQWAQPNRN